MKCLDRGLFIMERENDVIRRDFLSKVYFKVMNGEKMKLGNLPMRDRQHYVFFYDEFGAVSKYFINEILANSPYCFEAIVDKIKNKGQGYFEVYNVIKTMNRSSKVVEFKHTAAPYPLPQCMKRMKNKTIIDNGLAYSI